MGRGETGSSSRLKIDTAAPFVIMKLNSCGPFGTVSLTIVMVPPCMLVNVTVADETTGSAPTTATSVTVAVLVLRLNEVAPAMPTRK